jgi:hypothetical protein
VYLTRAGWFAADRPAPRAEPRRRGTLAEFATRYLPRTTAPGALVPGPLGEALSCIEQAPTLEFVLLQLVPYLRTLPGAAASSPAPPQQPPAEPIHELVGRASLLRDRFGELAREGSSAEGLDEWPGMPCAIVEKSIIPLERVARDHLETTRNCVILGGEVYTYRPEQARPFEELRRAFSRAAAMRARNSLSRDEGLNREAVGYLGDVKSLLDRYRPESRGRYALLYRDCHHEIHHSRGSWALVRGPVGSRIGDGFLFLALHLRGASRRQLLSVSPRPVPSPEVLWTPTGEPAAGGLCMGRMPQYQRLFSGDFTDPEATVQWTDGGVILATGRSMLHQAWRESGQPLTWDALLMERGRRGCRVD